MDTTIQTVDKIYSLTNNKLNSWKKHYGYAPIEASIKLDNMMFDWIISLTESLHIWAKKGTSMTDGELILASANLGSLVESMMKFVLSVYILDYYKEPLKDNKGKIVEPEKIKFENLKKFCFDKIWPENIKNYYGTSHKEIKKWVGKIQEKRNAIHAFNKKELGDVFDFLEDIETYYDFITLVFNTLPDEPHY